MKKNYLKLRNFVILFIMMLFAGGATAQNIWINELHYDNDGSDQGEFVEIVLENPGNYSLSDFTITLYNGSNGTNYDSETLDQFTEGNTSGNFTFYTWYPSSIQNGGPDGLCIDFQGSVISGQFLSYEGTFTATDGPANGMTSVDIGVSESGSTQVGESLQLSGNGSQYSNFSWEEPADDTPGALNNDQSFGGPAPEPSNYPTDFQADATGLSIELSWTDAAGAQLPDAYLIKGSTSQNITPPVDGTPEADDLDFSDGSGTINVDYGEETYTFYGLDSETTYYFEIYPYTNASTNINYKTDGTPPEASDSTDFAINTNDFESGDFGNWTTYSAASDKDWAVLDFGGALNTTYFAEMNGFQENELSNDWLISPALNMNNYTEEKVFFWTKWKYGNTSDELMLKYSTDYTGGDPTQANWTELSFEKPEDDDTWENSGFVDISSVSGENVYVAFQYLSSGSPRRWDVDEIEITGVTSVPVINVTSPMAGEIWEQGSIHDIEWETSNTQSLVKIELSTNASSGSPDWELLVDDIPADQGSWTWNIPPDQETSYDCQIRISDYSSRASGFSGIFSIIEEVDEPMIVISEIMYNPPESNNDTLEFIELYNNDEVTVNLEDYYFSDGIEFTFGNIEIQPGNYLLLSVDSMAMLNTFGANAWQWTDGGLSNSGELIQLVNPDGFFVDSVHYDDVDPWPTSPDGTGPSLRFCNFDEDNALAENWSASVHLAAINNEGDSIYATPGYGCVLVPEANFTVDTTIVLVGGEVTFTDLSTNDPENWNWEFEGGEPGTSSIQNPGPVVYNSEGEFNVTLTAGNEAGEDTELKEMYIKVGYAPVADFEASETEIQVGETVDFTDLSAGDPDSWEWHFEGGTPDTSSAQNPEDIVYEAMGAYDVKLKVTSMFGVDSLIMEEYIEVGPVGIAEAKAETVSIWPNPSTGIINLTANPEIFDRISIYNAMGKVIFEEEISGNKLVIDLNKEDNGLYFIRLTNDDESYLNKKIIINK